MPNQKEYFQRVANIAQYIIFEVNKIEDLRQRDDMEWLIHMGPNYSIDVIPDDGSLLLNATGGLPSNLQTPLGAFKLCNFVSGSVEKKARFMEQLIKKFGLIEVLPKKVLDYRAIYEKKLNGDDFRQAITNYGPIYAVTFDLENNPIPFPKFTSHVDRTLDKKVYTKKEWDYVWKAIKPDYTSAKKIAAAALPLNHEHESEFNERPRLEELKEDTFFEMRELKDTSFSQKDLIRPPTSFNADSAKNIALNVMLEHLPTLVAVGKQNEVDNILKRSQNAQELLVRSEVFTDCSGRTFNCTLFEYAYWAKDTYMCRMLVSHMDANTRAFTLKCCENIDQLGLMYKQHGRQKRSCHYNLSKIKAALKNYLSGSFYLSTMQGKWMKVGKAQCELPAHVINEYCRPDRSFDPLPSFKDPILPRKMTYYNAIHGFDQELFPLLSENSGLGFEFSLARQPDRAMGWATGANKWIIRQDLLALTHLDAVRTEELKQIRDSLSFQPAVQMKRY